MFVVFLSPLIYFLFYKCAPPCRNVESYQLSVCFLYDCCTHFVPLSTVRPIKINSNVLLEPELHMFQAVWSDTAYGYLLNLKDCHVTQYPMMFLVELTISRRKVLVAFIDLGLYLLRYIDLYSIFCKEYSPPRIPSRWLCVLQVHFLIVTGMTPGRPRLSTTNAKSDQLSNTA